MIRISSSAVILVERKWFSISFTCKKGKINSEKWPRFVGNTSQIWEQNLNNLRWQPRRLRETLFFWGGGGGGGVGGLERQRRRRLRKRHLQSKTSHAAFGFKLYRSSFMSCNSSNVGNIFHSWILTDCIKVQEKKKKVAVLRSDPPENVKLGIFASLGSRAVTTRKVKKSVMHVQSFCIANLNLLLSSCSRWRRRRRRFLSSLIVIQFPYVFSVIFKES